MQTTECLTQPQVIVIPATKAEQSGIVRRQSGAAYRRVSTDQEEQSPATKPRWHTTDKIITNPEGPWPAFCRRGHHRTSAKKRPTSG